MSSVSESKKTIPESTLKHDENEDCLEVDAPIPGQQFVCLSFVSPENVLPQKEAYYRSAFWAFIKEKYEEIDFKLVENLEHLYSVFLDQREQQLEEEFHEKNDFQTTVRGLKVRGVYNSMKEAEIRSKVLQKVDKHHHVFVAPVGYWLPWDPSADAIGDQVYQEEQLNELMKSYNKNETQRDQFYEEQKAEKKKQAMQENEERKKKNQAEKEAEAAKGAEAYVSDEQPNEASEAQTLFDAVENQVDHADLKAAFDQFKE